MKCTVYQKILNDHQHEYFNHNNYMMHKTNRTSKNTDVENDAASTAGCFDLMFQYKMRPR